MRSWRSEKWLCLADLHVTVDDLRLSPNLCVCLQRKIGGGEGVEGLYGSITCGGLQKILECFTEQCQMGRSSVFVDIGAGIGRSRAPIKHSLKLKHHV